MNRVWKKPVLVIGALCMAFWVGAFSWNCSGQQQVDTTVKAAECTDFLRVLRQGKSMGLPCPEYVRAARQAEPFCSIGELHCPDGGVY